MQACFQSQSQTLHLNFAQSKSCQQKTVVQSKKRAEDSLLSTQQLNKRQILKVLECKSVLQCQKNKDSETLIKKVINIFVDQCSKEFPYPKIIVLCLSLLSAALRKHYNKKNLIKSILTYKFVGSFVKIKTKDIMESASHIQNSITYLLTLIVESNFFEEHCTQNLLLMFKDFSLKLLLSISDNLKVIFQILKIIERMQNKNILQTEDYIHYQLVTDIKNKARRVGSQNLTIFELCFRILIKSNNIQQAFGLYKEAKGQNLSYGSQAFFQAVLDTKTNLSSNILDQVIFDMIISERWSHQLLLFQLFSKQIAKASSMRFIRFVEIGLIETLLSRWKSVLVHKNLQKYTELTIQIRQKSGETFMFESIEDMINECLNELRIALIMAKDNRQRQE